MILSLYIKDLFTDDYVKMDFSDFEKILLKSQLNNIENLANIFNDVSNSFTVPATAKNNRLLRYWYDRDIVSNFNANIGIPAYIEIGSIPYRYGVIYLEGGLKELNNPKNYKISFYSKNTQLSNLFGNDLINDLDSVGGVLTYDNLSANNFIDNSSNFFDSINTNFKDGNVITPLIINAARDIEWGSANVFDIGTASSGLDKSELFYAFRIKNIINGIQDKYNITFSDDFFGQEHFNRLFILNNNKDNISTVEKLINFTTGNLDDIGFNYATDTWLYGSSLVRPSWRIKITPTNLTVPYKILVKDENDGIISEFDVDGGVFESSYADVPRTDGDYIANYRWFIRTSGTLIYTARLSIKLTTTFSPLYTGSGTDTILYEYKISNRLPRIKVNDFFSAIMKMFKLIIRPITENSFYIDTLDNYYSNGRIIDISKYTHIDEVDYKKPELYSEIKFLYKKTDAVLGKKFRQIKDPVNDVNGYGSLTWPPSQENALITNKKELKVELPFENMLFERLTSAIDNEQTDILIGHCSKLNETSQQLELNDCGPIIFYNNGTQSTGTYSIGTSSVGDYNIWFKYGTYSTSTNIVYNVGNTDNLDIDLVENSINWGVEIDPWHNQEVSKCLFFNYWSRWIASIYDLRQMKFSYKCSLPLKLIYNIQLNDSLIIGSKRYRIESMTINLTNGDTDFELFVDTDVYLGLPLNL